MTNEEIEQSEFVIESYQQRFDEIYRGSTSGAHMAMARLAAFPVAVTPQLLYALQFNFSPYKTIDDMSISIPELAVSDCLLSNLFSHRGSDIYEMDAGVRSILLKQLSDDLGDDFIKDELASFLYQFSKQNTKGKLWRNFYESHEWKAIMTVDAKYAVENILSVLVTELSKENNTSRGIGIANLIRSLQLDNNNVADLLQNFLKEKETPAKQTGAGAGGNKKLVISDKELDGAPAIRLEIPKIVSSKLEGILRKSSSADPPIEPVVQQVKVFAVFALSDLARESSPAHQALTELHKRFREKLISNESDAVVLLEDGRSDKFIKTIRELKSKARDNDILLICHVGRKLRGGYLSETQTEKNASASDADVLNPEDFSGLINDQTTAGQPYIIMVADNEHSTANWLDPKNPKHVCIAAADPDKDIHVGVLTRTLLECSFADATITLRELYASLITQYIDNSSSGDLLLPAIYAHIGAWDKGIFSHRIEDGGAELMSLVPGMTGTVNEAAKYFADLMDIKPQSVTVSWMKRLLKIRDTETVECTSITGLYESVLEGDMQIRRILKSNRFHHEEFAWESIRRRKSPRQKNTILSLANRLQRTDILFVGASKEGSNEAVLSSIAFAFNVMVYCILEDSGGVISDAWQPIGFLPGNNVALDSAIGSGRIKMDVEALVERLNKFRTARPSPTISQSKVYGIFCGIGKYQDGKTVYASNDPVRLSDAMSKAGIIEKDNVRILIDDGASKDRVMNEFADMLRDATTEDVVVFYFGGLAGNTDVHQMCFSDYNSSMTSEGVVTAKKFRELIDQNADSDPTIVFILDTNAGSDEWLDKENPKHIIIGSTHPGGLSPDLRDGGELNTALIAALLKNSSSMTYRSLYKEIMTDLLLTPASSTVQTPMMMVHASAWDHKIFSNGVAEPRTESSDYNFPDGQIRFTFVTTEYNRRMFFDTEHWLSANHSRIVFFDNIEVFTKSHDSVYTTARLNDMLTGTVTVIGITQKLIREALNEITEMHDIHFALNHPIYFFLDEPLEWQSLRFITKENLLVGGQALQDPMTEDLLQEGLGTIIDHLKPFIPKREPEFEDYAILIYVKSYMNLPTPTDAKPDALQFQQWLQSAQGADVLRERTLVMELGENVPQDAIDNAIVEMLSKLKTVPVNNRRLYFYVSGLGVSSGADRLHLLLPNVSQKFRNSALNLNKYLNEIASSSIFEEVFAVFDLAKINWTAEGMSPTFRYSGPGKPSIFMCQSSEPGEASLAYETSGNITRRGLLTLSLMQGLSGAAAVDGIITTSSLAEYLSRSGDVRITRTGKFNRPIGRPLELHNDIPVIFSRQFANKTLRVLNAELNTSIEKVITSRRMHINLSHGIYVFRIEGEPERHIRVNRETKDHGIFIGSKPIEQWILIVGSGVQGLELENIAKPLGETVARAGYGIMNGGWPGLDEVITASYNNYFLQKKMEVPEQGCRIVISEEDKVAIKVAPEKVTYVKNFKEWLGYALDTATAIIAVGGAGATYTIAQLAGNKNIPVYPISSTGGDALRIMRSKRFSFSEELIHELTRPIKTMDDGLIVSEAIIADIEKATFLPSPPTV